MSDAVASQGAVFSIGGSGGSPATITDIELGSMTKVTAVAHGLEVGDVVAFSAVVGTTELNGQSAVIIAKEDDYFWVLIDSSGYTEYDSAGTATPDAWTAVGEWVDFDGPNGQAGIIDVSHLQSEYREKLMGLPDEGQFSMNLNLIFGDTGQVACLTARKNQTLSSFKVDFVDGSVYSWDGYVTGFGSSGGVDAKLAASITIEITGEVTRTPAA